MSLRASLPAPVKTVLRPFWRGGWAVLHGATRLALAGGRAAVGERAWLRLRHFLAAETSPTLRVGEFVLDGGEPIPYSRAVTLFTKEPDTTAWIDDFFDAGDVFYDVGANVGVYSLYAARRCGVAVVALEPAAENYAVLNRNIHLNRLDGKITALNIAAHNATVMARLSISLMMPGKAGNTFDERGGGEAVHRQGALGFRLDDLVARFGLPFPNHVKVDVDGNDPLVIEGLGAMLDDPRLKSIAVELKPERSAADREIVAVLERHGFVRLTGERYVNRVYLAGGFAHNHFFIRPGLAPHAATP